MQFWTGIFCYWGKQRWCSFLKHFLYPKLSFDEPCQQRWWNTQFKGRSSGQISCKQTQTLLCWWGTWECWVPWGDLAVRWWHSNTALSLPIAPMGVCSSPCRSMFFFTVQEKCLIARIQSGSVWHTEPGKELFHHIQFYSMSESIMTSVLEHRFMLCL